MPEPAKRKGYGGTLYEPPETDVWRELQAMLADFGLRIDYGAMFGRPVGPSESKSYQRALIALEQAGLVERRRLRPEDARPSFVQITEAGEAVAKGLAGES